MGELVLRVNVDDSGIIDATPGVDNFLHDYENRKPCSSSFHVELPLSNYQETNVDFTMHEKVRPCRFYGIDQFKLAPRTQSPLKV